MNFLRLITIVGLVLGLGLTSAFATGSQKKQTDYDFDKCGCPDNAADLDATLKDTQFQAKGEAFSAAAKKCGKKSQGAKNDFAAAEAQCKKAENNGHCNQNYTAFLELCKPATPAP